MLVSPSDRVDSGQFPSPSAATDPSLYATPATHTRACPKLTDGYLHQVQVSFRSYPRCWPEVMVPAFPLGLDLHTGDYGPV